MSRFYGLVFLRPDADLHTTLAPFDENDTKYMEFVDMTDEVKTEWDEMPEDCPTTGTFIEEIDRTDDVNEIWDEAPNELEEEDGRYTKKKYPTPTDIAKNKGYDIVPDETKRNGMRFMEIRRREWQYVASKAKYPTMDKLATERLGYCIIKGRYGYMSNPNAKYDWYGGRDYIINKKGEATDCELLTEIDWEKTCTPYCYVDIQGAWKERCEAEGKIMNKEVWCCVFKNYVEDLQKDAQASEIRVCAIGFHE